MLLIQEESDPAFIYIHNDYGHAHLLGEGRLLYLLFEGCDVLHQALEAHVSVEFILVFHPHAHEQQVLWNAHFCLNCSFVDVGELVQKYGHNTPGEAGFRSQLLILIGQHIHIVSAQHVALRIYFLLKILFLLFSEQRVELLLVLVLKERKIGLNGHNFGIGVD